jgi:hypothetical protein
VPSSPRGASLFPRRGTPRGLRAGGPLPRHLAAAPPAQTPPAAPPRRGCRRVAHAPGAAGVEGGDEPDADQLLFGRAGLGAGGSGGRRGRRNQGVEGPSQLRYVQLFEGALRGRFDAHAAPVLPLASVELPVGPQQARGGGWRVSMRVRCGRATVFDSLSADAAGGAWVWGPLARARRAAAGAPAGAAPGPGSASPAHVSFPVGVAVWGDVRLEVLQHARGGRRRLLFFVQLHTAPYEAQGARVVDFAKSKVDMLHKDSACLVAPRPGTPPPPPDER